MAKPASGRRKKAAVDLTEAEWDIIQVVWKEQPCAAGTVQEALEATRAWTYATVKLTMDRMVDKGFLTVEKIRNLNLFSAKISEVEARRLELNKMLKRAFNGTLSPMLKFLIEHEGLSTKEANDLREFVNKKAAKKK